MSREGRRAHSLHLTEFLHEACMMDGGAELVDALVCGGVPMESTSLWSGTEWSTRHLVGTSLFKAACVACYGSVQELVWQGASLKASCTAMANPTWLEEATAGSSCHDAELAAMLHPSTYRWVDFFSLLSVCAFCPAPLIDLPYANSVVTLSVPARMVQPGSSTILQHVLHRQRAACSGPPWCAARGQARLLRACAGAEG